MTDVVLPNDEIGSETTTRSVRRIASSQSHGSPFTQPRTNYIFSPIEFAFFVPGRRISDHSFVSTLCLLRKTHYKISNANDFREPPPCRHRRVSYIL